MWMSSASIRQSVHVKRAKDGDMPWVYWKKLCKPVSCSQLQQAFVLWRFLPVSLPSFTRVNELLVMNKLWQSRSVINQPSMAHNPTNQDNFFIQGITCTSITYNACISACGVGGAWVWALRLFWQMTMQGTGVRGLGCVWSRESLTEIIVMLWWVLRRRQIPFQMLRQTHDF